MLTLVFEGSELVVTGNHPILVIESPGLNLRKSPTDISSSEQNRLSRGRWVEARELRGGDSLVGKDGDIIRLLTKKSRTVREVQVYNLEIRNNPNYHTGSAGVVVHNKGGQEPVESSSEESSEESSPPETPGSQEREVPISAEQKSAYGFAALPFVSEEEAYDTYLRLRKEGIFFGNFYIEAGRWFAENGAIERVILVLSNLDERIVRGGSHLSESAMVFETIGIYDKALEIPKTYIASVRFPSFASLTYLAELYWLAGISEEGQFILRDYIPLLKNHSGSEDSSRTDPLGGVYLSLYLDALLLSGGIPPDLPSLDLPPLSGEDWIKGLRIKALWPGWEEFGLMVIEPSGEGVFYDNYRSNSGALYRTQYKYDNGPDEIFYLPPQTGEYQIYMVYGDRSRENSPAYETVRISVQMPAGAAGEQQYKLFFVDIPYEAGIYPVGTITITNEEE